MNDWFLRPKLSTIYSTKSTFKIENPIVVKESKWIWH